MKDAVIEELAGTWEFQAEHETDKGRREMLRQCADTLRMLIETLGDKPKKEEPKGDTPCPECNANGVFKFSPKKDCICQGRAWLWKLG